MSDSYTGFDVQAPRRELGVLDTREYGFVRFVVGQGSKTRTVNVSVKKARKFAKAILKSAKVAEQNHLEYEAEKVRRKEAKRLAAEQAQQ